LDDAHSSSLIPVFFVVCLASPRLSSHSLRAHLMSSSAPSLSASQLAFLNREGFVLLAERTFICSPGVVASKQVALVLGMAFISESYAAEGAAAAQQGTTVAVVRDRARLLELEKMGTSVISFNSENTAVQCSPQRHLHARFDRRAVSELIKTFGTKGQLALDAIYGDYFRFPTAYMRAAFHSFLRSMLPELIQQGVMGIDTQLILPNLRGEDLFTEARAKTAFKRSERPNCCGLSFEPITAQQNPLFVATERVADETVLGGYSNESELEQLHPTHPFMRIRIRFASC
jgi:hypothetical protein